MAAERDVACPSCGHVRSTKANPGVRLSCPGCSGLYLAPSITPGTVPDPTAPGQGSSSSPKTPSPGAGPASSSSGVQVDRARPVIPQAARPRERGVDRAPTPEPAAAPAGPPPGRDGKTGDLEELRAAGRRGGLASYAGGKIRGW